MSLSKFIDDDEELVGIKSKLSNAEQVLLRKIANVSVRLKRIERLIGVDLEKEGAEVIAFMKINGGSAGLDSSLQKFAEDELRAALQLTGLRDKGSKTKLIARLIQNKDQFSIPKGRTK